MRRPLSQCRPRSSCGGRCCRACSAGPPRRCCGSPSALSRSPPSCAPAPAPHHPPVHCGSSIAATVSQPSVYRCFRVAIHTAAAGGHAISSGSALVPACRHTNRWPSRQLQQFPGVEATDSSPSACWGSGCVNTVMGSPPGQVACHYGRWRAPGPPSGAPGPPAQPPASHSGLIWLPLRSPLSCVGSGWHLMNCHAASRRPFRAAGERSGTAAAPASPAQSRPLACSLSTVQPSIATLRCVLHMRA